MTEISAFIKGTQRALTLSVGHVKIQREVGSPRPGRGFSPEPDRAGFLISDFKPPKL